MLDFKPVEIYGWVLGSISGLTLKEIFATLLILAANKLIFSSSSWDSTLKNKIPYFKDSSISSSDFATPEKTIFLDLHLLILISQAHPMKQYQNLHLVL